MPFPLEHVKQLWAAQEKNLLDKLLEYGPLKDFFLLGHEELALVCETSGVQLSELPRVFLHHETHEVIGVKLLWPESESDSLIELMEGFRPLQDAFTGYENVRFLGVIPWPCPNLETWLRVVPAISVLDAEISISADLVFDPEDWEDQKEAKAVEAPSKFDVRVSTLPASTKKGPGQKPKPGNQSHLQPVSPAAALAKIMPPPKRQPTPLKNWAIPHCPVCRLKVHLLNDEIRPHLNSGRAKCVASGAFAVIPTSDSGALEVACDGCGGPTRIDAGTGKIDSHCVPGNAKESCPWQGKYMSPRTKKVTLEIPKAPKKPVPKTTKPAVKKVKPPVKTVKPGAGGIPGARTIHADRTVSSVRAYSGGSPGSR